MIATVDTNILLSVFFKDSLYVRASDLLEKYSAHQYIINDIIYLELCVHFPRREKLDECLEILEITLLEEYAKNYEAIVNGWRRYLKKRKTICPACGKILKPLCSHCSHSITFRQKILADFIIGGFALANSHGILTLDTAHYKNYFPQLKILN